MATVIIDTRSKEAKKCWSFLKPHAMLRYWRKKFFNDETEQAIRDVEEGRTNANPSAKELMASLKKKAGV